eukprot:349585-Chlamydomonas_euryale.AAC.4
MEGRAVGPRGVWLVAAPYGWWPPHSMHACSLLPMRSPCRLPLIACFVPHRHTRLGPLPVTLTLTLRRLDACGPSASSVQAFTTRGTWEGA